MRDSATDQRRAALAAAWVGTLFLVLTGCHRVFPYHTEQGSDGRVDALVDTLRVADSEPFRDLVRRDLMPRDLVPRMDGVVEVDEGPHRDQSALRVDRVTVPLDHDTVPHDQVTPRDCDQSGTWGTCTGGPGSCTLTCTDKNGDHAVTCKAVVGAGPDVSCGCSATGPSIIEYKTATVTATCGSACGMLMATQDPYYLGQMSACPPEGSAPP